MRQAPADTRTATVLSAVTASLATVLLGYSGFVAYDSAHSDRPLAGLGYLVALVLGVPAMLGLALAVPAFGLRRRRAGTARTLGWCGLVSAGLPALLLVWMLSPV
jgi:hypothetical protein